MSIESNIEQLVRDRKNGVDADDSVALAILRDVIKDLKPANTNDHAIKWHAKAWLAADAWDEPIQHRLEDLSSGLQPITDRPPGWLWITRGEVFERADGDPIDLFLAAMAWGFGTIGYGWRRAADIIRNEGEEAVENAVRTLKNEAKEGGPTAAFRTWSRGGKAKLQNVDTAFASKLAYFAGYDRTTGTGPLIADRNTAWGFWALTNIWDIRTGKERYGCYVERAETWAHELQRRSDDIERSLFETIGPQAIEIWKQLNA